MKTHAERLSALSHREGDCLIFDGGLFTPRPWEAQKAFDDELGWVVAHDNLCVVEQINEADARLIAAAPELYQACKEFVRKCNSGEASSKRSYAQMSAAIAKAEGKA